MLLDDDDEKACDIIGFEGFYSVTDKGRVYSHPRNVLRKSRSGNSFSSLSKGRWMKLDRSTPYLRVRLQRDGEHRLYSVHRLVALAFIDKPEGKDFVNHKDGNKGNNFVNNLEWCTQSENEIHAKESGLLNPTKGEAHPLSKLTESDVRFIRESKLSGIELAEMFSVPRSSISKVINFRSWKHVAEENYANDTITIDEGVGKEPQ